MKKEWLPLKSCCSRRLQKEILKFLPTKNVIFCNCDKETITWMIKVVGKDTIKISFQFYEYAPTVTNAGNSFSMPITSEIKNKKMEEFGFSLSEEKEVKSLKLSGIKDLSIALKEIFPSKIAIAQNFYYLEIEEESIIAAIKCADKKEKESIFSAKKKKLLSICEEVKKEISTQKNKMVSLFGDSYSSIFEYLQSALDENSFLMKHFLKLFKKEMSIEEAARLIWLELLKKGEKTTEEKEKEEIEDIINVLVKIAERIIKEKERSFTT